MPLSPAQQQNAQLLYGLAVSRGLPPARAREFVAAAYSESGLNPKATNRSSGAAGFYQLLSGGYRSRAQALGGLYNPRANALAILPDYQSYWRQHPNALPGEAGRDVERSGMGSQFYSRPLSLLGGFGGGTVAPAPRPTGAPVPPLSPAAPPAPGQDPRRALAAALLRSSQSGDYGGFFQTLQNVRQRAIAPPVAQAPAVAPRTVTTPRVAPQPTLRAASAPAGAPRGGLAEAFYDPLGSYDSGHFGGPIGGHSDHVHLSITNPQTMLAAIHHAQQLGLRVGENPYVGIVHPVHVHGSFHYRTFPGTYGGKRLGEAIDVSGDPRAMAAYYRWATNNLR